MEQAPPVYGSRVDSDAQYTWAGIKLFSVTENKSGPATVYSAVVPANSLLRNEI